MIVHDVHARLIFYTQQAKTFLLTIVKHKISNNRFCNHENE